MKDVLDARDCHGWKRQLRGPIVKQKFWLEKRLEKRLHMPF